MRSRRARHRFAGVLAALLVVPTIVMHEASLVGASAFPGANGKIAFQSDRDGNNEIYRMDGDGTDQTRLTSDLADDFDPSWSADGKQLAFFSFRDGNFEIYVMDGDGSDQTRLTNNPALDVEPSWSPDGEQIAFASSRAPAGIYVMDADGSNQTLLSTAAFEPSWSPDGERIAFTSERDGNSEIYVMDADGSNQTRLTNNHVTDSSASWSPDGKQLAFSSFRDGSFEIFVMDADGSNQTQLTDVNGSEVLPAWSPDGERIAFTSERDGNREVYVMDADGSDPTNLTHSPAQDAAPSWQPREVGGDVTVTKRVNGTPPAGTTFAVEIVCDDGDDHVTKTLTFGETGGTQTFERESFGPLECEVTERQTGGASSVEVTCANAENAECTRGGTFELFDDPGGDDTHIEISVTNTFAVTAEPTFTG